MSKTNLRNVRLNNFEYIIAVVVTDKDTKKADRRRQAKHAFWLKQRI